MTVSLIKLSTVSSSALSNYSNTQLSELTCDPLLPHHNYSREIMRNVTPFLTVVPNELYANTSNCGEHKKDGERKGFDSSIGIVSIMLF